MLYVATIVVFVAALPAFTRAGMTKMTKEKADSNSVQNAVLATLGTNIGSLISCSTLCILNPSCLAFIYQSNSCIMVNRTLLASPTSNTSGTPVYISAPASTNWTSWTAWSSCSTLCEGGTQSRNRTLLCNYSNGQTIVCPNNTIQADTNICNAFACLNGTAWSTWTQWSLCTVTCGGGTQQRNRTLTCSYVNGTTTACPNNTVQADSPKTCHNFNCACRTASSQPETSSMPNTPCVFPFTFGLTGVTYPSCSGVTPYAWCATASVHNQGDWNWGNCNSDCPRCQTVDGPVIGADCSVPFTYNGITYQTCTNVNNGANNGKAWCATGSTPTTQWGICDDSRMCPNGN